MSTSANDGSEFPQRGEIDLESPDSPPPKYRARQSRDDYFSIPVYRPPPSIPGRVTPEHKFRAPLSTRRPNPRATDTPEGRLDPVWLESSTHPPSSLPAFLASDSRDLTRTPSNASSKFRVAPKSRTPPPSRPLPPAPAPITLRYSGSEPVLPSYQPPKRRITSRIFGGFNSLTNLGHYPTRPSLTALAQPSGSVLSFDSTSSDSSITPRAEDFPSPPTGVKLPKSKRPRRRLLRPSKSIRRIREFLRRYFSQHPIPVPPLPHLPRKISSAPASEPPPAQPSEPQNTPSMTSKIPGGAINWPSSSGAAPATVEASSRNPSKSMIPHLSLKRPLFRSSASARAAPATVRTDPGID